MWCAEHGQCVETKVSSHFSHIVPNACCTEFLWSAACCSTNLDTGKVYTPKKCNQHRLINFHASRLAHRFPPFTPSLYPITMPTKSLKNAPVAKVRDIASRVSHHQIHYEYLCFVFPWLGSRAPHAQTGTLPPTGLLFHQCPAFHTTS